MMYTDPTFFVPFLFVLAIVFGALKLTNVFRNNAVNAIISIVLAIFAATYSPFTTTLYKYLPSMTWFFIIMFFVAFMMELAGLRNRDGSKPPQDFLLNTITTGFAFVILFSLQYYLNSIITTEIPIIGNMTNMMYLIGLIFVLMLFYYAYNSGSSAPPQSGGKK